MTYFVIIWFHVCYWGQYFNFAQHIWVGYDEKMFREISSSSHHISKNKTDV
jgi:hypothetical protein